MDFLNNKKYKNILSIIAIIKFGSLLFISLILIDQHSIPYLNLKDSFQRPSLLFMSFISLTLIIIYILWTLIYIKSWDFKHFKLMHTIENTIFFVILSIFINLSGTYGSHYKFIFIFAIISTIIGFGKQDGIILAIIYSAAILLMDLKYWDTSQINICFENDLLLSSGFIILAWILGDYVKFEKNQRELLEAELSEQLKQHDYIEEMLINNDACYNLLFKQSPDAIVIHNIGELMYLNDNALNMLGFNSLSEIYGSPMNNFQYENNETINRIYKDILLNKKTEVSFEEKITTKDGVLLNIQNTSSYCTYSKKPAILTIIRNITPEKEVQKLKADALKSIELLNESKEYSKFITEFFTNISHELKTPLNVILSSLQMLILYNENFNEDIIIRKKEYLLITKQNCFRLLRLINNILDVTKLDAGFITAQMENNNIVSLVEELTLSMVSYAENKGIDIIFDTDTEEKIIAFDPDKIERIILNLLSNALKFTGSGGQIYVNITDLQDVINISIKDTGIGIPEDKLETIFDRFMQVDKTLRRNNEGSGIGLSIVKSFVELQGGQVKVKSKLNFGSEFIISLPAIQLKNTSIKTCEIKNNLNNIISLELSDISKID